MVVGENGKLPMFVNEDNQQTFSAEEIKRMHERDLTINASGEVERVPYPVGNPPIFNEGIVRPTLKTFEEGLEWNKQFQEHWDKSNEFTQMFAEVRLEPRGNKIGLIGIADTHWSNKGVDYERLDRDFKIIENTPDVYAVLCWNLLDNPIAAQFPDGLLRSGQSAQEAVYTFKDKLDRLYKLNKLVGAIGKAGCHENWTKKRAGWAIYRELFDGINIPLLPNGGYLDVLVKDERYKMAVFHKTPYWSTLNKTHGGERMMDRIANAEIVFTSHRHQAATGLSSRYNPPFSKDTSVLSLGTYLLNDEWALENYGKQGEKPGQGIMLWATDHTFENIYHIEKVPELMK